MNRRHFVQLFGSAALSTGLSNCSFVQQLKRSHLQNEFLVTPYSPVENPNHDFISMVSLTDFQLHMIPCSKIEVHGIAQHPTKNHIIAVFSHHGPKSLIVDLKNKILIEDFASVKNHWFYGHGSFSRDGNILYATEYNLIENAGLISIRDGNTYKVMGHFPSHGILPHEIYLMPDQKTAVIANQGYKPQTKSRFLKASLTYVDIASGKLLHKIETSEKDINFGHLAVDSHGNVAGGADHKILLNNKKPNDHRNFIFKPAPMYFGGIGKTSIGSFPPKPHLKEKCLSSLSLCINEKTNDVAVTYPQGGIINFWSMKDFTYRASLDLNGQRPLGVTVINNGQSFAVNTSDDILHIIDSQNYKITQTLSYSAKDSVSYFQGPHLMNIKI